jgi:predicted TIM-barrel fold metal-dependent hydrolase
MYIDADTHIFPKEINDTYQDLGIKTSLNYSNPIHYDLSIRQAAMKDAGFEKQVLIIQPMEFVHLQQNLKEKSIPIIKKYNDEIGRIQKQNEEFIGCAEIPALSVTAAIEEAKRCVNDLGFKTIGIRENWLGVNIESQEWWPFFEAVHEMDVPLWYHGAGSLTPTVIAVEYLEKMAWVPTPSGEKKPIWVSGGGIGQIGQAVGAFFLVTGMILSGLLKQYPNLKVVLTETGASLAPFVGGRVDKLSYSFEPRKVKDPAGISYRPISMHPSEYLQKNFWYDVDYVGEELMPILVRELGMGSRILAMTDYPHLSGDQNIIRWIQSLDISESDKEKICGKNAADLLNV